MDFDLSKIGNFAHPVFVTHPETGKKALYVNRLMTARIEGFDRQESDALLEELFAVGEDPAIIYEHVWRPGDLVMWDNWRITHARTDFRRRALSAAADDLIGTEAPCQEQTYGVRPDPWPRSASSMR